MNIQVNYKNKEYQISAETRPGNDSLILLIHGLGCVKESFVDILDDKRFSRYSLLMPDLLGHGESDKPSSFSYTMEDQAGVLEMLLDQLKYKDIKIVMHSMGGAIGLLLAQRLKNLRSIVNIEGNLIPEDSGLLSRRTASTSFEEFEKTVFDELRVLVGSNDEVGAKYWFEWTKRTSPSAFYKSAISLMKWSDSGKLLEIFEELPVSKAYFYGDKNNNMPVLEKLIDIKKYEIRNSGHFLMKDNPEEFYQKLSEFIDG